MARWTIVEDFLRVRRMRRLQLLAQQFGLESDADEVLPEVVVQLVGNAALLARDSRALAGITKRRTLNTRHRALNFSTSELDVGR